MSEAKICLLCNTAITQLPIQHITCVLTQKQQEIDERDATIAQMTKTMQAVLTVPDERDATIERLRDILQDVTDVAHSRQRTEWRDDSEQDAIDRAYAALAEQPSSHSPDECHHPDDNNCPCDCHSSEFDDRGAAFILGKPSLPEAGES